MAEKVGIYVCHCGSNIAGMVDVEEVARWAGKNIKDVAVSRDYKFMCSSLGQQMIEDDIKKEGLTRVVVAACSPHLHEKTFRRACQNAGLNPYLCQMTNVREHVSWVTKSKEAGTEKVKALVSAAAERVKHQQPLEPMQVKVNPSTLVVGGGIAGLQAALELADAGYHVYLVERRTVDRRAHGPLRQDLPHAGLLGVHPDAQDVGGRAAREHNLADVLGVGGSQRLGRELQGQDSPQGALRGRRQVHRLRPVHRGMPDPVPSL